MRTSAKNARELCWDRRAISATRVASVRTTGRRSSRAAAPMAAAIRAARSRRVLGWALVAAAAAAALVVGTVSVAVASRVWR